MAQGFNFMTVNDEAKDYIQCPHTVYNLWRIS